ncbi:AbrB/MazE/SpoVT family DNA-binding domain-containing protein [Sandaracinobacteroides saxicola]|uniref:AbrB/MazE/SpoVT family DNA-binding domain-containing protein n=1 Tax=Sandaracinobacteroides saxicola TaxID=2759707 RepID=A0A7G5IJ92_9SPHN|nr:AbrB/MazE/SpoVT family DNA-binding domain-containing protein [Sandaracinobacteroides saxicola]QMW23434.1 AbrB/MazE/SpoVT family DNA-binding domain-containing protein [Sandaracinobacteroides saxicola]
MTIATLTTKGQVTIPADLRSRLGLEAGMQLDFSVTEEGHLLARPRVGDIRALKGSAGYVGPALSLDEIEARMLPRG